MATLQVEEEMEGAGPEDLNTRDELERQLEELKNDIEFLQVENSVYKKYLEKKRSEMVGNEEDEKKKSKALKKKNFPSILTTEQKYEIANTVNEQLHQELEADKRDSEKQIDSLKAVLEETEVHISELKRDAYEFKRDVVVGAENPRTGKIMAEKVTRYFEDKLKSKDVVIEKLKLKNRTLKSQEYKIEHQLAIKDDAGDSLHYIDFHQLQIENKQFLAKIEERNQELLTMKLTTGKTLVSLNNLKKQLLDQNTEFDALNNGVVEKKSLLGKSIDECKKVQQFVRLGKKTTDKLKTEVEDAQSMEMPNIEDYIMQKKSMYEYQASLETWKKKIEILEMAAQQSRTQLQRAKFFNSSNGNRTNSW